MHLRSTSWSYHILESDVILNRSSGKRNPSIVCSLMALVITPEWLSGKWKQVHMCACLSKYNTEILLFRTLLQEL